ncbi:MAG TPA: cytochrome P450 [Candidatus Lustribacter sp.]
MTATLGSNAPRFDLDLFGDEILTDPYPTYERFRAAGPVVYLPAIDAYALARYDDVRAGLADHATFISGRGIGLSDEGNATRKGVIIASDNPLHDQLRSVLSERLSPKAMNAIRAEINVRADALVAEVVARTTFDAVTDLAQAFPLTIVADLIGLPAADRLRLLEWADAGFNLWGPRNERNIRSLPVWAGLVDYIVTQATREKLTPGSMGAAIYEAADRGVIAHDQCPALFVSYLVAGVDTTINAIGNAVALFAAFPEQWNLLREKPGLIPSAFEEVLRIDAPLQLVRRYCVRDIEVGGTLIPADSNVVLIYASGNRDDRKYPEPGRFDVTRNPLDHLTFGYGLHGCAGQALARLEAHAIFRALVKRVERFEVGTPVRRLNNVMRGLEHLPVTVSC